MHKDFAEWYRARSIEPSGELLPKRWAGIERFTGSRDDIVSLTRLFYGLGKPSDTFLAAFRAVFQDADAAFQMRGNDQELVVLAGAKLVHLIEQAEMDVASMSALSLVCAAAQNLRHPAPVADILEKAVKYLQERSVNRSASTTTVTNTLQDKELLESIKDAGAPWDVFASAFENLLNEHRSLKLELPIIAEESNMLWWLFSEYSRDMKQAWSKLSLPAAALIAGKELADLTRIIPGPIAATAFLDKAIRRTSSKPQAKVSVKDALNDTSIEWRQQFAAESLPSELLDLAPISQGIRLSITAPDESWLAAFEQSTGLSADSKMIPFHLAYQIYLEALLCRSWKLLK